ncbi:LppA family lipoprotein [Nocardia yunnanensis]|uniref:LppA family lipoprotein n=1 Tax=Nocardia yunnanensis TaxID=2382165 RepID=UPI0013C53123|nr:LppA family lipoprotein [Nocardia yunnanensis]
MTIGISRISIAAAFTLAVIATTTGCGSVDTPYKKTGPADTAQAEQVLRSRPTFEDTHTRVTNAVQDLAAYASSLVPGMTWKWTNTDRQPWSCGAPYDQTAGRTLNLPNYITEGGDPTHGGIPDAVWPQVREKARQLAADLGATQSDPVPTTETPGNREARFIGDNGTVLWLSTRGISSETGCRLLAADKASTSPVTPTTEQPK